MQKLLDFLKQNSTLVIVTVMVLVGFALYANTLGNAMFWDDDDFILNNQYIRNWQHLPQLFSENVIAGSGLVSNYWRPVLLMVFSAQWHLWGDWTAGYHAVNMLFHIADALLVFLLLQNLFRQKWLGAAAAFMFLIHPLQTESVAYANSLGDSLSVFFMLLGLNNHLHYRQQGDNSSWYWSIALGGLAIMSKETAIIYPALIVLVDLFYLPGQLWQKIKTSLGRAWPHLALFGLYLILRATLLNFQNTFNLYNEQNVFTESILVRIFTFFKILTTYFGLLFYPHDLHMERGIELGTSLVAPGVWQGALLFTLCVAAIIFFWKNRPVVSFGLMWFLAALSPTSNILVPINGLLYEHWLYAPMIGFWLAIFGLLISLVAQRYKVFQYISIIFLVSYIVFLCIVTISRNRQWHDPVTFYEQTLKYSPNSYRLLNNLGMSYADAGRLEDAESMYNRAVSLDPQVAVAYHNLGNLYHQRNQTDEAARLYQTALQRDPKFFFSYNALTSLYLDQKKYPETRGVLEQYLEHTPDPRSILELLIQVAEEEKNYTVQQEYITRLQNLKQ